MGTGFADQEDWQILVFIGKISSVTRIHGDLVTSTDNQRNFIPKPVHNPQIFRNFWPRNNLKKISEIEKDTVNAKSFAQVYPEIKKRLQNRIVVAHNESFDRNVLAKSMLFYNLDYSDLNIASRWECTVKIYKAKGLKPTKLSDCCREMNISLNHHEALSDARACAKLYLMK